MLIFSHTDETGRVYNPQRFGERTVHVVDPGWIRSGQTQRFSEANSEDVLFDFLNRGFHLWVVSASDANDRKLVPPTAVTIRFGSDY